MKITIKEDIYSETNRKFIYDNYYDNKKSLNVSWIDKDNLPLCLSNLVEFASKEFDLSDTVGYELWTHYNTKPDWHYDKDETLYNETKLMRFPICSIVYYPLIENITGGKFITEDISISPKTNMAITFSPGVLHNVEPYIGNRFSLLLNPWSYKIRLQ